LMETMAIMTILSASTNAIIAGLHYQDSITDYSEFSFKNQSLYMAQAFCQGIFFGGISMLSVFIVYALALTAIECFIAAIICGLIGWMLEDNSKFSRRNGNETWADIEELLSQGLYSAGISFGMSGFSGGGVSEGYPEPPRRQVVADRNFIGPKGIKWPDNYGGIEETERNIVMEVGTLFDRYGERNGRYVAEYMTPYEQRSLPYIEDEYFYEAYRVIKPIDGVVSSVIDEGFTHDGGGIQYRLPNTVQWLLDNGYIEVIYYWG